MALKTITPPASEPVTLTEAKQQCRVDTNDDDALITGLIAVAREYVEAVTNRALITQTLELVLDQFPAGVEIILPAAPLQSVTSITYTDADGTTATFNSANYIVDADSQPGRVALKSGCAWPTTTLQEISGVRVRYVAGFGLAAAVPQKYKQAMLLLIGHWYENREQVIVGSGIAMMEIPLGVKHLLWLDRVKTF